MNLDEIRKRLNSDNPAADNQGSDDIKPEAPNASASINLKKEAAKKEAEKKEAEKKEAAPAEPAKEEKVKPAAPAVKKEEAKPESKEAEAEKTPEAEQANAEQPEGETSEKEPFKFPAVFSNPKFAAGLCAACVVLSGLCIYAFIDGSSKGNEIARLNNQNITAQNQIKEAQESSDKLEKDLKTKDNQILDLKKEADTAKDKKKESYEALTGIMDAYINGKYDKVAELYKTFEEKYKDSDEAAEAKKIADASKNAASSSKSSSSNSNTTTTNSNKSSTNSSSSSSNKTSGTNSSSSSSSSNSGSSSSSSSSEVTYSSNVTYAQLLNNPTTYKGKGVVLSGKVIQISQVEDETHMFIAIDGNESNLVVAYFTTGSVESNAEIGDKVTFKAISNGTVDYELMDADPIHVPALQVTSIAKA